MYLASKEAHFSFCEISTNVNYWWVWNLNCWKLCFPYDHSVICSVSAETSKGLDFRVLGFAASLHHSRGWLSLNGHKELDCWINAHKSCYGGTRMKCNYHDIFSDECAVDCIVGRRYDWSCIWLLIKKTARRNFLLSMQGAKHYTWIWDFQMNPELVIDNTSGFFLHSCKFE